MFDYWWIDSSGWRSFELFECNIFRNSYAQNWTFFKKYKERELLGAPWIWGMLLELQHECMLPKQINFMLLYLRMLKDFMFLIVGMCCCSVIHNLGYNWGIVFWWHTREWHITMDMDSDVGSGRRIVCRGKGISCSVLWKITELTALPYQID